MWPRSSWLRSAQEDEGTKEAKNHQLLTEDIDSILARAEVLFLSLPPPQTSCTEAPRGGSSPLRERPEALLAAPLLLGMQHLLSCVYCRKRRTEQHAQGMHKACSGCSGDRRSELPARVEAGSAARSRHAAAAGRGPNWALVSLVRQVVNEADGAGADVGGELLNAFNVKTFANEEDDAAFWNRLIPVAKRNAKAAAAAAAGDSEPEELGIRAARLKNTDDVSPAAAAACTLDMAAVNPHCRQGVRLAVRSHAGRAFMGGWLFMRRFHAHVTSERAVLRAARLERPFCLARCLTCSDQGFTSGVGYKVEA